MTAQPCFGDTLRKWRRVVFFRSAPYSAMETALAHSPLAQGAFEDVILLVQEDAAGEETVRLFGDQVRVIKIPSGPFTLATTSGELLNQLRALCADAFVLFYNNADHLGYSDIETLGLLSGIVDVVGVGPDNRISQVTPQSVARHEQDPFFRWRNSPYAQTAAANFLRYLQNVSGGNETVSTYPWYMYVEPSRNCNLRCPGCRVDAATSMPDMPIESFTHFVDEVGPYLYQMVLYRGGESIINKHFARMLEYAYENTGAQLVLSSNMSHRLAYGDLERIVRCCDLVDVTIDGLTPKTYGEYRVRGNFDLAFANMMKLARLAESRNSNCHVRWRFIVFSYNEHEVEEARRIAEDVGVELQLVRPQLQRVGESKDALDLLPADRELWRPEYGDTPPIADRSVRCGWLHGGAVLNYNMTLSPCCELQREFAHVDGDAFLDAYNSAAYVVSRREIVCEGCAPSGRNEWNTNFDGFERRVARFLLSGDNLDMGDRRRLRDLIAVPGSFRSVKMATGPKEG